MNGDTLAALFILAGTIGIVGFASIFGGEKKVEPRNTQNTRKGKA